MKGLTWLDLDTEGQRQAGVTRGGELQVPANRGSSERGGI